MHVEPVSTKVHKFSGRLRDIIIPGGRQNGEEYDGEACDQRCAIVDAIHGPGPPTAWAKVTPGGMGTLLECHEVRIVGMKRRNPDTVAVTRQAFTTR